MDVEDKRSYPYSLSRFFLRDTVVPSRASG